MNQKIMNYWVYKGKEISLEELCKLIKEELGINVDIQQK